VRVNGVDRLAVTKFDVLSGMPKVKICTAYRLGDKVSDRFPRDNSTLDRVEPIYEEFEGWQGDLGEARRWAELPASAQRYLEFIAKGLGVPIGWVGVGPERKQVLRVEPGDIRG